MSAGLQHFAGRQTMHPPKDLASPENSFTLSFVSTVLHEEGILDRRAMEKIRLEGDDALRAHLQHAQNGESSPITPVDIINALKLPSQANPGRLVTEESMMKILAAHWKLPFLKIELSKLNVSKVTPNISEPFARKHLIVPVLKSKSMLLVALVNPLDFEALEMVKRSSKCKVRAVISTKSDILTAIEQCYGHKRSSQGRTHLRSNFHKAVEQAKKDLRLDSELEIAEASEGSETQYAEKYIVKALDALLFYAVTHRAGDIHLEPKQDECIIRLRIDGMLHELERIPLAIHQRLIVRLKALAKMNIAEKRKPLDGSFRLLIQEKELEFRISTMPVLFGEKVMLRLLDATQFLQPLDALGFSDEDLTLYRRLLSHEQGLILITGPTGSGKTTTLYSSLKHLSEGAINITTIEDPIELIYEPFNQIAVQAAIGLDFGMAIRHIVRQAPDVIMIGEIRDRETAENAFQAALTGHLVFSTLHTNDAASAIIRLADLGVSPALMETALLAVVSQRLVRKLCEHCATAYSLSDRERQELQLDAETFNEASLRRGSGCEFCFDTGYSGRSANFEILQVSDAVKSLIHHNSAAHTIQRAAKQEGMRTLRDNALDKFQRGRTSREEVLRIVGASRY